MPIKSKVPLNIAGILSQSIYVSTFLKSVIVDGAIVVKGNCYKSCKLSETRPKCMSTVQLRNSRRFIKKGNNLLEISTTVATAG